MASPKIEVFFLFTGAGVPLTGQTGITFDYYKNDLGVNLSQPTITEVGGGAYKFTPVFTTGRGIVYVINTNGANPERLYKFMRPEDFYIDDIQTLLTVGTGKWEVKTSGPDANRLLIYDTDGTTVLYRLDLFDQGGSPTFTSVFKRVPV